MTRLPTDGDRPLSARSVMASLLLGRQPPAAPARDLVRWCERFGITAGTARVALHRMTTAGELVRTDEGYQLVGSLARRQREQESSLDHEPTRWDHTWRMAIVVGDARPARVRTDLREALRRARLAEWREGVWMRPANLPDLVEDSRCEWVDARPDLDAARLADRLFRPVTWRQGADALLARLDAATTTMRTDPEDGMTDAFLAGAASLRHIRADPLLPAVLLPEPWPGRALRAAYRVYQREFTLIARAWFRASDQ
ncbi:MAG: PaaX family transcriptional regulator C-terminal domain-containing protein [Acidimicrobiia bacterium]